MNKSYPFKFLDAYSKEDRAVFFGRDEEITNLYDMVFQSSVILIYGASGTGKTSLINCGLAGKFQPHDWLPLMVRRGNNINESLEKTLENEGGSVVASEMIDWTDDLRGDFDDDQISLSPVGNAIRTIYQNSFRPIYLIFDQFEELYILGRKEEQEKFISTVKDILASQQPVKLIFSIREEYLGYLFEFEQSIPQLMQNKLRVEPMNLGKIKSVIVGASQYEGSNVSLKAGESDEIALGIFEKIRGNTKSLTIQLPFLQVFLDKFYRTITDDKSRQSDAEFSVEALEKMDQIGDVLVDFLNEQVTEITTKLEKKYSDISTETIWKILTPFTTLEGTKDPIGKKDLYARLPNIDRKLIDDTVSAFVQSRILRHEEDHNVFEVAHDSLAKPISEKRSAEETNLLEIRRMISGQAGVKKEAREPFTERQLIFMGPHLEKLELTQDEWDLINNSRTSIHRQKRKKRLRYAVAFAAMAIAFVFMLFQALDIQNKNVDLKKLNAQNQQTLEELKNNQKELKENESRLTATNLELNDKQETLNMSDSMLREEVIRAQKSESSAKRARQKAEKAERILNEIKDSMLNFQEEMRIVAENSKTVIGLFRNGNSLTPQEEKQRDKLAVQVIEFANSLKKLEPYKDRYNRWGYKDGEGGIAIYPRYEEASPFDYSGVAQVKNFREDTYFKINSKGEIIGIWDEEGVWNWRESTAGDPLPSNAFQGGYRIDNLDTVKYYVCRAMYNGAKHVGRTEGDSCHLGWGGKERILAKYDLLTKSEGANYKWVPQNQVRNYESMNWEKFAGGWNNSWGIPLYIGQSIYKGRVMPGKIWEAYRNNYVVYEGKEIEMKKYSYLMIPSKDQ